MTLIVFMILWSVSGLVGSRLWTLAIYYPEKSPDPMPADWMVFLCAGILLGPWLLLIAFMDFISNKFGHNYC